MDEIPVLQLMGWPAHALRTSFGRRPVPFWVPSVQVLCEECVSGECVCGRPHSSHSGRIHYSHQLERGPCWRPLWDASIHYPSVDLRLSWDEGLSSLSFSSGMTDKLLSGEEPSALVLSEPQLSSSSASATSPGCEQVMTAPRNLCVQSLGDTELVAFIFWLWLTLMIIYPIIACVHTYIYIIESEVSENNTYPYYIQYTVICYILFKKMLGAPWNLILHTATFCKIVARSPGFHQISFWVGPWYSPFMDEEEIVLCDPSIIQLLRDKAGALAQVSWVWSSIFT